MMTKKLLATTTALTLLMGTIAAFTSCTDKNGGDDSQTTSTATNDSTTTGTNDNKNNGKKVTLEVLTNRTDRDQDGTLDKLVEPFEQANNCEIKWTSYSDYSKDVPTRMSTDDYGDVLFIPDEVDVNDLGDFLVPLGTYDELKDKYNWVSKKMDSKKNVYGLAYGGNAMGILYNKKVWADAGITELPKTPEDFLADLKLIKEKTEAIPYYTEYADSSWTINQWCNLLVSASGNPGLENDLLTEKTDLFTPGNGYYDVMKLMYDVFSDPDLHEADPMTTEWESSKTWFGEGKIGTIVLGSWAISQFEEKAGDKAADVGYMPAPFTAADGKQYAQTDADFCVGVSKHSKDIDLSKKFVEWFVSESGFAFDEGMIPTPKGSEIPSNLDNFKDCVLFEKDVAPDDLIGKYAAIDTASEVGIWLGDTGNFKIQLAEAAFGNKGEEGFKAIIDEQNKKWADARDAELG